MKALVLAIVTAAMVCLPYTSYPDNPDWYKLNITEAAECHWEQRCGMSGLCQWVWVCD